jgi:hypothetical protein
LLLVAIVFTMGAIASCSGDSPSSPELSQILAGKGGNGGGGGGNGPTVDSADPNNAPQGTTLDVRVLGSGYDETSDVKFLLNGKPTPSVKTNATQFVSSEELVANITIDADAVPDDYDIQATNRRGKGVGIELFTITNKFGQVALEITFRDDPTDGLRSDGMTGLAYCDPSESCYEEQQDFVAAHLSGNGNLLFWLDPQGNGQGTTRRIEVLGELLVTRRIYTNDNQDDDGVTVPDLRTMADGTITARMIVERGDANGHYRYGVNCVGDDFGRDDANAIPGERISVTRTGDTWIFEGWGARHCVTSGKGKKAIVTETPVSMPFRMTTKAIPWPE